MSLISTTARFGAVIAAVLTIGIGSVTTANAKTITETWGGAKRFDDGQFTFAPVLVDTFLGITGNGYFHDHDGSGTTAYLQLRLDTVWTTIHSQSTSTAGLAPVYLASFPMVSFVEASLSGIWLQSDPAQDYSFHKINKDVFRFHQVPEPTTLAIMGLGLAGLGFARRKKAA